MKASVIPDLALLPGFLGFLKTKKDIKNLMSKADFSKIGKNGVFAKPVARSVSVKLKPK